MEIIGKVSRGSMMDQVYIPKNRTGFAIGNYVIIRPLEMERQKKQIENLYFYRIKGLEPIKLEIIQEVMRTVDKSLANYDNVFITGSFLDEGFHFNDIDILIVIGDKINQESIKTSIEKKTGVIVHILTLSNKDLRRGLETDPLYQMMLSKCVAKKRFVYKNKRAINYKLLDLHLLKSKNLINSFDILSGKEKYDLTRNMIAISLYLDKKKVSVESVNKEIKRALGVDSREIKENILDNKAFLKKYKSIYNKIFSAILRGIKNGSKQE